MRAQRTNLQNCANFLGIMIHEQWTVPPMITFTPQHFSLTAMRMLTAFNLLKISTLYTSIVKIAAWNSAKFEKIWQSQWETTPWILPTFPRSRRNWCWGIMPATKNYQIKVTCTMLLNPNLSANKFLAHPSTITFYTTLIKTTVWSHLFFTLKSGKKLKLQQFWNWTF